MSEPASIAKMPHITKANLIDNPGVFLLPYIYLRDDECIFVDNGRISAVATYQEVMEYAQWDTMICRQVVGPKAWVPSGYNNFMIMFSTVVPDTICVFAVFTDIEGPAVIPAEPAPLKVITASYDQLVDEGEISRCPPLTVPPSTQG
ncbi:hypothetical protein PUNSTDRAFT_135136 [Punctularia strigosozonata HHB-11173 SS5]|uniref:uncharacterized protein n=1 Tax=Punctularia strigosozonata (strain HHB-11173) TaxID=741275 RepID=UPI000441692F|nr:uncharacterized protein PUNSTDRAFT_135136 [Punctularia strigosozonata HHB-11173 SS5]EIN07612.1 hypothetical protein PUNSTDRAFT_135136 [Punctularia strigosozonata HHB-11173 SS5]